MSGVGYLADQWFIACPTHALRRRPRACIIQDVPLVLFRDEAGRPAALLDPLPASHRAALRGTVDDGLLDCGTTAGGSPATAHVA